MLRRAALVTLLITVGFVGGLVLTGRMRTAAESVAAARTAQPDGAADAAQSRRSAPGALPDLTNVAQRAIGAVTNISSTQPVRNNPYANDPFWRFFAGQDMYRQRREQSRGSGVVVSADGYVLTNSHVVGDARSEIAVVLSDKREHRATIVGVDEFTDLAVLKIDASGLPVLPWGDSSKLKIAEWVLAIGNPYGVLNQTVTLGIVSATGRSLEGRLAYYEDFIQTDAAINPGNSGGALIDARGQLVGINTAIFSETGGYQGIGFAVPSNLARHVLDDIVKYGSVRRGMILGIELMPMTTQLAARLGAKDTRGVLVYRLDSRAAAYEAGLDAGDIIVTFDGTPVDDAAHFMRLMSDARIGSTVALGILRDGRPRSVKVPIEQPAGRTQR
jgi:serine protease Do